MAWQKSTTTKHTCGGPTFGRKTQGCPRCDELFAGATPVVRRQELTTRDDIRSHDCKKSRCMSICTAFDY